MMKTTFNILVAIFVLLINPLSHASLPLMASSDKKELALIQDPDGYVNIREGKGTKTSIVGKIKEGEIFYFEPNKKQKWLKVQKWNTEGYVHKSRISPISLMPDKEKISLVRETFKKERSLGKKRLNSKKAKREFELHHESTFNLVLNVFIELVCNKNDDSLFEEFSRILEEKYTQEDEIAYLTIEIIHQCRSDLNRK